MKAARDDFTAEDVRRMLHYDPRTGAFTWLYRSDYPRKWNTRYAGKPAGTRAKTGYIYIEIQRKMPTKAARIAWLLMIGKWPEDLIDHRNGRRDDDRWENLRLADHSENSANKTQQRNNSSGHIGVSFDRQRGKWRARINFRRTMHDVGFFDTAEAAAQARRAYQQRLKVQGDFTPDDDKRERYFHYRDAKRG